MAIAPSSKSNVRAVLPSLYRAVDSDEDGADEENVFQKRIFSLSATVTYDSALSINQVAATEAQQKAMRTSELKSTFFKSTAFSCLFSRRVELILSRREFHQQSKERQLENGA